MKMPDDFPDFLKRRKIQYAIVGTVDGKERETFGDANRLKYTSLIPPWFEDMAALAAHLENRVMPHMLAQKPVACLICKPVDSVVVGLFRHDTRHVTEQYRWGKEVDAELKAMWAGEQGEP